MQKRDHNWEHVALAVSTVVLMVDREGYHVYPAIEVTNRRRTPRLSYGAGIYRTREPLQGSLGECFVTKGFSPADFVPRLRLQDGAPEHYLPLWKALSEFAADWKRDEAQRRVEALNERSRSQNYSHRRRVG